MELLTNVGNSRSNTWSRFLLSYLPNIGSVPFFSLRGTIEPFGAGHSYSSVNVRRGPSYTRMQLSRKRDKRDRSDIDKIGVFGLWLCDATNSADRSWWDGFSRLEWRRGVNVVVRDTGRSRGVRAGPAVHLTSLFSGRLTLLGERLRAWHQRQSQKVATWQLCRFRSRDFDRFGRMINGHGDR